MVQDATPAIASTVCIKTLAPAAQSAWVQAVVGGYEARLVTENSECPSLVTDKGAMILHMLRFVVGDNRYLKIMRDFATEYAGKPATSHFQSAAISIGVSHQVDVEAT